MDFEGFWREIAFVGIAQFGWEKALDWMEVMDAYRESGGQYARDVQ
jgi:hypothetical protein